MPPCQKKKKKKNHKGNHHNKNGLRKHVYVPLQGRRVLRWELFLDRSDVITMVTIRERQEVRDKE
jgi:hypothetical protein